MIIDYGMGNLRSVANAFRSLGHPAQIVTDPAELSSADRIVLPGVGAFGDGMRNLNEKGWTKALEEEILKKGKPFLGLCLGMQLLATTGTEHGRHDGLNWVPGTVVKMQVDDLATRVPHIGWNDVQITKAAGLYAGLGDNQVFYFVHSYVFQPENSNVVTGVCSHGPEFIASVEAGNISGTQYHPEKSQKAGITVLGNFLSLNS